jgi:addiction module HigA family antidote
MKKHLNVHPGELLREEFLGPMGITPYRLAKDAKLPHQRVNEIVNEKRSITAETDLPALILAKRPAIGCACNSPTTCAKRLTPSVPRSRLRLARFERRES